MTKARTRSPFQATDDFPTVYTVHRSMATTGPASEEEKSSYLNREHIEYVNAERTIAVSSGYRNYDVLVRTDLAISDVVTADAEVLVSEEEYYADLRERGVWFPLFTGIGSKTAARQRAERLLGEVQDVARPLHVALDGKYAPALTIALKEVDNEREWRRDDSRVSAVRALAEEAKINPLILALAIKEERLEWATPPVAPKQVMVVVRESESGNLSERLVDEIVLATHEVEGLGRIVHEGSVSQYLLHLRTFQQQRSVEAILRTREQAEEALQKVQSRATDLLESLAKGQVIGRGFHDTLRLSEYAEQAQSAASAYAAEVAHADLPHAFLEGLCQNAYADTDTKYRYLHSDVRSSLEALAALNGMEINRHRY